MGLGFRLRQGSPADLSTVTALIEDAAAWLRHKGTRQWQEPWPSRAGRDARVLRSLRRGETWLLWDGAVPVGTVTARMYPNHLVWPSAQWHEPAVYLHQLVVDRAYAGRELGARLFDWAGWQAHLEYQVSWVRIDVWTDNLMLHRYYEERGFTRLGRSEWLEYPSGMLFQKSVGDIGASLSWPFEVDTARHGPLRGVPPEQRYGPRSRYGLSHRTLHLPRPDGGR